MASLSVRVSRAVKFFACSGACSLSDNLPEILRIIGVPRSGTNLAKYLIEMSTDAPCAFNIGWWKHLIIPSLMNPPMAASPTIIMFREPVRQLASFFTFASKGRSAITGEESFDDFLRSPISMRPPNLTITYTFSSPTAYWLQYYQAALSWSEARKHFVDLGDLRQNPSLISLILDRLKVAHTSSSEPKLPDAYLGRHGDEHMSTALTWEADMSVADQNLAAERAIEVGKESIASLPELPEMLAIYETLKARSRS